MNVSWTMSHDGALGQRALEFGHFFVENAGSSGGGAVDHLLEAAQSALGVVTGVLVYLFAQ